MIRMFCSWKELYQKIKRKRELRNMNEIWEMYGGNCFGLMPPSLYRARTQEEIIQRRKEALAELKKMLDDYQEKMKSRDDKGER